MDNFTRILGLLSKHMPFLLKCYKAGPMRYVIIQIIGLLIHKVTRIKDADTSHKKVLEDQILMDNLVNEVVVLDERSKTMFNLSHIEKPNWLIMESWVILLISIILALILLLCLINMTVHSMVRVIMVFFLFSLLMIIKNVINYRFVQNAKHNTALEVILLKTLIHLYNLQ
jgi:hypothetical protein